MNGCGFLWNPHPFVVSVEMYVVPILKRTVSLRLWLKAIIVRRRRTSVSNEQFDFGARRHLPDPRPRAAVGRRRGIPVDTCAKVPYTRAVAVADACVQLGAVTYAV
ncbi:hypothetical protein GCM10020255_064950 [Rhodococcus baikonurensis]